MRAAIIEDGVCINAIVVRALGDVPGSIELPDCFGVGDLFDGQTWSIPAEPEATEEQP